MALLAAAGARASVEGSQWMYPPAGGREPPGRPDLSAGFGSWERSAASPCRRARQAPQDAGLVVFAHTAEPGSESAESLDLLASWAATADEQTGERA